MSKFAPQITAFEAKRGALIGQMETLMEKAMGEGSTLDAAEQETYDGLTADVGAVDGHLKRLRALELAIGTAAKTIDPTPTVRAGSDSRDIIVRAPQALAPGIGFARLAKCKALGRLDNRPAEMIARSLYGEDSIIFGILSKATVAPAMTTVPAWAGVLVGAEGDVFADFVEFLRPRTILGRFGAGGVPSLRRVPFRVRLLGQTSGGAAYWVGEGKPKPLTKFDFGGTTLGPLKVANIAVSSMEVLRDSSPAAEAILRDQLAAAVQERLDIDFINPAKAPVADVSPGSVLNGVAGIPSSGSDADAVRSDLKALFQVFIDAENAPTSGVWIMSSSIALSLSLMNNPLGQPEFGGITLNGGTLLGLPVITSGYMGPPYMAAGIVALVNAADIYEADEGGVSVDMSNQASLEMSDTPTQDGGAGTGAQLVSLWQNNLVAFLAERTINWARRRASAVAYLTGVEWGSTAT